jgi:cytochrome c553
MFLKSNKTETLYPYSANILIKRRNNNINAKTKRVFLILLFICLAIFAYFIFSKKAHAFTNGNIEKGKQVVIQSGCVKCHSFVKGKRIDRIVSLAGWRDKHLTLNQTEKAIRSCKADIYCSQILTDKQVQYVARYLNSLK